MTQQASQYSVQQVQDAHQALSQAADLYNSGDPEGAVDACNKLIETYPDYARAHVLAAIIYMQHGNYGGALPHLTRARMVNSKDASVLVNLGKVHLELGATHFAIDALEQSAALAPNESMPHYFLGEVYLTTNDFKRAAEAFETALARDPANLSAQIRLGHCQASVGDYEKALSTLKDVLAQNVTPTQKGHVFQILADFPIPLGGIDLIAEIDKLENEGTADGDPSEGIQFFTPTIPLMELTKAFARGITFDKLGRHREAWDVFVDANRRVALETESQRKIYFQQGDALLDRAEQWQPEKPKKRRKPKESEPISLFILGPSRVGKATLERLVGALDGASLGSEHTIVRDTARKTSQRSSLPTERLLANLPSEVDEMIADIYAEELAAVSDGAKVMTVTHPGVISDVGRLADLVPNARFVLLKRNRDDLAFRIFAYMYQPHTNEFAYDINDIYRYLDQYDRMTDIWLAKLGDRALLLNYEEVLDDPEGALRSVAELCGLKAPTKLDVQIFGDAGCADPYREWLHQSRA